jgi:aminopeptidase YwaD
MRVNFLRLSLILLVAVSVLAQQPAVVRDWPSVERLRGHVTYLASDKLEGRRTGTQGARLAAEYIVREFARYKLRPGGAEVAEDRRYLQQFPYVAGVRLGKENSLRLETRLTPAGTEGASSIDLRPGEDWMPLGLSSNGKLQDAPVVFAGYGITAKELNYDDYAGAYVKGRVAVVLAGTPDGDDPHGKFARYGDVRWKAIAARDAGALALLVVAREEAFKQDAFYGLKYDNAAGDAGIPALAISRQAALRLLGIIGRTMADVEKAALNASAAAAAPAPSPTDGSSYQKTFAMLMANMQLDISVDVVHRDAPGFNVVGILEGSDPVLKSEAIVIGAHYDHLGLGGDGSLAPREGEVHHGADDNASGVAGMLELARLFSAQRPRRTIIFIAFSGEEEGLLGSNFYVNHPSVPLNQTVAMINMDMIGRSKDDKLMIGGVGTAQQWRSLINGNNIVGSEVKEQRDMTSTAPASRSFSLTLTEDGYGPSDHSSFYSKQVPVLFFWTGTHDDYHKPSDTADKINYEAEARIIAFIANIVRAVDRDDRRPTFTTAKSESAGRNMGFRVYLGTIPNYADSKEGLKLDGVRDDSPAARAGLKAGDVIIKLAGREVRNVYDYTFVLGEMKAGQEYEVEILRDGKPLKLKITPAARKQ